MKKIIILIAIIANFGFCDTLVKIYNRTTGEVVNSFHKDQCPKNSLYLYILQNRSDNLAQKEFAGIYVSNKETIKIACNEKSGKILALYDYSMFSYSVEETISYKLE